MENSTVNMHAEGLWLLMSFKVTRELGLSIQNKFKHKINLPKKKLKISTTYAYVGADLKPLRPKPSILMSDSKTCQVVF